MAYENNLLKMLKEVISARNSEVDLKTRLDTIDNKFKIVNDKTLLPVLGAVGFVYLVKQHIDYNNKSVLLSWDSGGNKYTVLNIDCSINDTITSLNTLWSSQKIQDELNKKLSKDNDVLDLGSF